MLAVALFMAAAPLAAQGSGRVQGRVLDSEGGRPLEGARVRLSRSGLYGITDQQGRYVIPRVPAGRDTISVAYIGREPQARVVNVAAGDRPTSVDFSLGMAAIMLEELTSVPARAFVAVRTRALMVDPDSGEAG